MAEVEQQLSEHSRAAKLGLRANGPTTARGHLNMTHARNLRRLQLAWYGVCYSDNTCVSWNLRH